MRVHDPEAFAKWEASRAVQKPRTVVRTTQVVGPSGTMPCPMCKEPVSRRAVRCKHCGGDFRTHSVPKSDAKAGVLGFLLGPVGLWYKGEWAAGFAWLAVTLLACFAAPPLVPLLWAGSGIHAFNSGR